MAFRPLISIFLLWCAGIVAAAQFAKIAVPFPEVAALFPVLDTQAGLLLSSVSLVGAVFGLWAGAFVARLDPLRALLGGLAAGGVISVVQAAPLSFEWMLASRVAEGAAHLVIIVSAPVLIAGIASARTRSAAMAFWSTFFTFSFAIVAWVGLPFVAAHGARSFFLAHGVLALLLAGALAVVFRPENRGGVAHPAQVLPQSSHAGRRNRARILAPGVGWFFYTFTFVAIVAILPGILPPGMRTGATSTLPLMGIAVSLTLGPLLLQVASGLSVAVLGFVVAFGALVSVGLGGSLVMAVFAIFAAFGLIQCGTFAAVPELNESATEQATAHGIIAQAGNLGNLIGTPILLAVVDRGGVPALFVLTAVLYALAVALSWSLRRAVGSR